MKPTNTINGEAMMKRKNKIYAISPLDGYDEAAAASGERPTYSKRYLQKGCTSDDFLESVSYIIPLEGTF